MESVKTVKSFFMPAIHLYTKYRLPVRYFFTVYMLLTFFSKSIRAQDEEYTLEKYRTGIIHAEFDIRFKKVEDKNSFKQLREFLNEKKSLHSALEADILTYSSDTGAVEDLKGEIKAVNQFIEGKKKTDSVELPYKILFPVPAIIRTGRRNPDSLIKRRVSELDEIISSKQQEILNIRDEYKTYYNLKNNIDNVKSDILKCSVQIDSALAPEYQQQDFRKNISISFSVLIGLLLCIFFFIVYKRSDNNLSKELLSGNGLQFITLFVLIIAVILFGILSILGSSELAAILSGISGYILGKGTQKDLNTAILERDRQSVTTNAPTNQTTGTSTSP